MSRQSLGSYAGAMGGGQFMPSSYRAYAVDGDGDGRRDLWGSWDDVIASVANYLAKHGWRAGEPVVVPASLWFPNADGLVAGKLAPDTTVKALRDRGLASRRPRATRRLHSSSAWMARPGRSCARASTTSASSRATTAASSTPSP